MRKTMVLVLILLFASTTLAFATWKIVDLVQGEDRASPGAEASSAAQGDASEIGPAPVEEGPAGGDAAAAEAEAAGLGSGEDQSYGSPDQRYVTETQRHQNFFAALAEGKVKRLDAMATDYQPVGDPNSSYLYFTLTTTDGSTSDGTMVLKYENGMWRIAAVRQLLGTLGGGTNYPVPDSFAADLAREISEQQDFLAKVAQGELDYLVIDDVSHPSATEAVLTGRVVGIEGRIERAEMHLRKDYDIWHLTSVVRLGRLQ